MAHLQVQLLESKSNIVDLHRLGNLLSGVQKVKVIPWVDHMGWMTQ